MKEPKYLKIKKDLLQKIENGIFKSGDKFYTETEIKNLYNVSSITAIRAVQELANEGYLERYQGKGTFVSRSKKRTIVEFTDLEVFAGMEETVSVLEVTEMNNQEIKDKLKLAKDETYYKIVRLRKAGNIPYILQNSFIPSKFIKPNFPSNTYFDSIYQRFKEDFGINLYETHAIETNEFCSKISPDTMQLLELKETDGCILQVKTNDNGEDEVYEYVESYKHCEYYKIQIETVQRQ
ncbi:MULTISPECIES: GntR family transcriptional regulator [Enterococcus]|uniref:GntR family transcriptional regulator n=1 Tax=Enterococcus alishanensis TaxID=1303817 RepID=A0ABS6TDG9_9ENTE|nr:GntR family transcriptional regulator [Enterococcus alishanensis]MBV7390951.1 GntR family transcriptional regulator [Enterococcus alishanensis]